MRYSFVDRMLDPGAMELPMTKPHYLCSCLMALMINVAWADSISPYAGQEERDIKALSSEDVEAYLSGKGMGLAKAAELNGYPGPAHVLALATELDLTPDQKQRTEALFRSMEAKASDLGHALIEQERELDQQFASKAATQESVAVILRRIGELQAGVRAAHLQAHLAQLEVLTPSQVAKYQQLRGYAGAAMHPQGHQHQQ
jgi:Spy/CpxP family protein refolding chaperone